MVTAGCSRRTPPVTSAGSSSSPVAPLCDAQCWVIVSAADNVSTATPARMLGVPYNTVNNARWRVRREGWTGKVQYVACEHCGDVFTNDLPTNAGRRYHPACRVPGLRRVTRAGRLGFRLVDQSFNVVEGPEMGFAEDLTMLLIEDHVITAYVDTCLVLRLGFVER